MPPAAIDGAGVIPNSPRTEKKHKRDKSEHKKKRAREEDESAAVEETPRKPKKSKSERPENSDVALEATYAARSKHKKKHQDRRGGDDAAHPYDGAKKSKKAKPNGLDGEPPQKNGHGPATEDEPSSRKKSKKHKHDKPAAEHDGGDAMDLDTADRSGVEDSSKRKHKEKKSKRHRSGGEPRREDLGDNLTPAKRKSKDKKSKDKKKCLISPEASDRAGDEGAMEIDAHTSSEAHTEEIFPFFTQAVSLYVPFFPVGFDKPLTNVAAQHLDPLLNHYSPMLRGVLLSYSNLNLSDRPVKASAIDPPTDETPTLLHSVDEYAVGFGWLTFDAQLFVPARGKWMEGVLRLQNEGHIGVVCWNKFNASIEVKRLPKGWKWVDLAKKSDKANGSGFLPSPDWDTENAADNQEEDVLDGEELQVVEQMHTTGYWVNERGRRVSGKLRFRIKNFDVGLAGDYGYLSIEGTFLDDDAERALAAEEREAERRRRKSQNAGGLLRPLSRRVPEFSMTKLGKEEQEEDSGQRTVVYKGSRPGTPDD